MNINELSTTDHFKEDEIIPVETSKPSTYSTFALGVDAHGGILPISEPGVGKFGGTGALRRLDIYSGTYTLDLGGVRIVEKNYSTITVASGATLAFSNAHANGTTFLPRLTGNANIQGTINLNSLGGGGGVGGALSGGTQRGSGGGGGASSSTAGGGGTASGGGPGGQNPGATGSGTAFLNPTTGGQGGDTATLGTAGLGGTTPAYISNTVAYLRYLATPGSGGGGGGGGPAAGGAGGNGGAGGGALYIEVAGSLNFTGTINANGAAGGDGPGNSGGGGGGGGGAVIILYNKLIANSGTITTTAGAGGGGITPGGAGGAGFSQVSRNTYFT